MALSLLSVALFSSAIVHGSSADLPAVESSGTLNVGIIIMDGLFISEATIPFDVFKHVPSGNNSGMNTFFVAESMNPVTTYYGTRLKPHYTFSNAPNVDILVVPSGIGSHWSFLNEWYGGTTGANGVITGKTSNDVPVTYYGNSSAIINYVKTASASAKIVTSHCWGAFTLADANVLDNHVATTFPGYTDDLTKYYPAIQSVVSDKRMVVSGKVLTSNGGLAAFEAALYVVRHIYGDGIAKPKVVDGLVFSANNVGHSKLENYKPSPAKNGDYAASSGTLNVGILLPEGNFVSEPAGPFDVFAHMPGSKMKVFFVAEDMNPKTTYYGATMYPDYTFATSPNVDILVIPSGIGSHWSFLNQWYGGTTGANGVITGKTTNDIPVTYYGNLTAMIKWVKKAAANAKYVTSHCWGAFTLADAGLLDGKTATTFPGYTDALIQHYPKIRKVVTDNRIVQDGKVITSAGGVAAYEAANYVVKLIYGEQYAKTVATGLVYAKDNYDVMNSAYVETQTTTSWGLRVCMPTVLVAVLVALFAIL